MGMWDFEAWDNDGAADWFGDLMDQTKIRDEWHKTITLNDEDSYEEIRAAIWLFAQLGRVYVWPIDHLDEDIKSALKACDLLLNSEELIEEVPDFLAKIMEDRAVIQSRAK